MTCILKNHILIHIVKSPPLKLSTKLAFMALHILWDKAGVMHSCITGTTLHCIFDFPSF